MRATGEITRRENCRSLIFLSLSLWKTPLSCFFLSLSLSLRSLLTFSILFLSACLSPFSFSFVSVCSLFLCIFLFALFDSISHCVFLCSFILVTFVPCFFCITVISVFHLFVSLSYFQSFSVPVTRLLQVYLSFLSVVHLSLFLSLHYSYSICLLCSRFIFLARFSPLPYNYSTFPSFLYFTLIFHPFQASLHLPPNVQFLFPPLLLLSAILHLSGHSRYPGAAKCSFKSNCRIKCNHDYSSRSPQRRIVVRRPRSRAFLFSELIRGRYVSA